MITVINAEMKEDLVN